MAAGKPKLHVHFHPVSGVWCLASDGQTKIMQIGFMADITHDDPRQTLILIDAFPEGTRSKFHFHNRIVIRAEELVSPEYQIWMMVTPVVGKEFSNWNGRIVFVDQFKRKYKSEDTFEFMWGGGKPTPAPESVSQVRAESNPVGDANFINHLQIPSRIL
jgi:hypothetical protein